MSSVDERVARYAGAIYDNAATFEHDFPAGVGNVVGVPDAAFVTSTLADAELAALVAERDELRAEVERLRGEVKRVRALADAFADDGLMRHGGNIAWHIEEAIANEKGDFPDAADRRIASQRERAETAEAKLARVGALADEWEARDEAAALTSATRSPGRIAELRAVLADAPAEQWAEGGA